MGSGQIDVKFRTKHVIYQKLAGLEVPSLSCKCKFQRPEHNVKWGLHGNEC